MFRLTQACEKWVLANAFHDPSSHPFILEIVLKNGSLEFPYFVISDTVHPRFCIPVSNAIALKYSSSIIQFTFLDYGGICLVFRVLCADSIELLVSQFNVCCSISHNTEDLFKPLNCEFLFTYRSIDLPLPSQMPSVTFPIVSSKAAKATWDKRCLSINLPYLTTISQLTITFLTFNVAQQNPSIEDLSPLAAKVASLSAFDAIFIALQEVDFSAKSLLIGKTEASSHWLKAFRRAFHRAGVNLALILDTSLGSLSFLILVKPDLGVDLSVCSVKPIRLGAGGLMANKGGIVVRTRIGEAFLSTIACHLPPFSTRNDQRISNIRELLNSVENPSDYTVLFGDLNFRVLRPQDVCVSLSKARRYSDLLSADQLKSVFIEEKDFSDFFEGEINFAPSYRYDRGTTNFDSSSKKRAPAYTDRVLMRVGPLRLSAASSDEMIFESDIVRSLAKYDFSTQDLFGVDRSHANFPNAPRIMEYTSLECLISDHFPVVSIVQFDVPHIEAKREAEMRRIMRLKADEFAALQMPKVQPNPQKIELFVGKDSVVGLKNCSNSWAKWKEMIVPKGISISPHLGVILVGECEDLTIHCVDSPDMTNPFIVLEMEEGSPLLIEICFVKE